MGKYFKEGGGFTSLGARKYGFQRGNNLGKKFPKGSKHPDWNGGYKHNKTKSGKVYLLIKVGGRWVFEHRVIYEKYIGRNLNRDEIVHHKDGNSLNNKLSNLELIGWGEHTKIHTEDRLKHPVFICSCGNDRHFAKKMCSTCYGREYARKKFDWKSRKGERSRNYER